jgi:hypothetical protein
LGLVAVGDCFDFGPLCTSAVGDAAAKARSVEPGLQSVWGANENRNRPPRKDPLDPDSPLYDSVMGTEADLSWSKAQLFMQDGARLGRQYVVFDSGQVRAPSIAYDGALVLDSEFQS